MLQRLVSSLICVNFTTRIEMHLALLNVVRHFKLKHSGGGEFPKFEVDQVLFFIDTAKYKLYFTPREHVTSVVKEMVEKL